MKEFAVLFAPEAEEQLDVLYRYIAEHDGAHLAEQYTTAIIDYCESMRIAPQRGTPRDDIRPGLRITHYRGRTAIAFAVDSDQVQILGLYYGGQDYEAALKYEPET